jgi:proprotein convertase subtilisin/kexin type 5
VGCQPISGVTQYFYINACYAACPSGTYALVNATCLACDINCKTCITAATTCTSCESPNFLSQPSSGTCVATCTGGYTLYDNVNRVCVSTCPSNLLTTGLNCDYCPVGTYKDSTSCVSNCTSGYYADATTHACLTCDSTCLSCDGSFP